MLVGSCVYFSQRTHKMLASVCMCDSASKVGVEGGREGDVTTDICRSEPLFSPSLEDSGPGVGKIHRGGVFKACELGDDPPSDP